MTNIAEILKDCPKGTKLYSPFCGECCLYCVEDGIIRVSDTCGNTYSFYKDGRQRPNGERLLFPSRENRDWSTFTKTKFEKGDFIYTNGFVCIFAGTKKHTYGEYSSDAILVFACIPEDWSSCTNSAACVYIYQKPDVGIGDLGKTARLATEAEKNMLLDAIKLKGYEWDAEKLELRVRKPEFKVFDRVLVRNHVSSPWNLAEYAFQDQKAAVSKYYTVGGSGWWKYCIPYKGNEHLLGTAENCE